MKIGIKDDVKEKMFEIIQDSYYTDIEFVNIKGGDNCFFLFKIEPPKMKDILMKEKCWPCICGDLVRIFVKKLEQCDFKCKMSKLWFLQKI